jgi:hypothetical protein
VSASAQDSLGMPRLEKIGPHIYVLGEVEEPAGPVKIGMHDGSSSASGAPGLSRGNWRELTVLHRMPLELQDLRWSEWLIHRRLWSRHVRGEWFEIRDLVPAGDWQRFLQDVLEARFEVPDTWQLGVPGHELVRMKRVGARGDRRQFEAICSCGFIGRGEPGTGLSTVLISFACNHLSLDPMDPQVLRLKWHVHHKAGHAPTSTG